MSPGRLLGICPIRCTSTRLLLLPLCRHRIDPITIGSGQRSITAQRLSNSCQMRYVTVRYAHDRRARQARSNPHNSHYQNLSNYQNLSKRLFRYCFIASFCAPALSRRYYTAGSTSHTQYGWWRPSRSRRTQRGTPPQRQRRGRESVRGISAPNAAPQPPQPPPRARSARRARVSALMPRSDAAL